MMLLLLLSLSHMTQLLTAYPAPSTEGSDGPNYAADSHLAYFQSKYSFFPPFTFDDSLPYDYGMSTILLEDAIRLTPDAPSKKGWLWSKNPIDLERWEAIFTLQITGKAKLGGDGLAFWWTKTPKVSGPVFGNQNHWEGLGIMIDTYDNDGDGKHPYLSAVWNDGTVGWDHNADGGDIFKVGCKILPKFRNKYAIQIVVSYFVDKVQVLIFDESKDKWYDCLNMSIPYGVDSTDQYFGFTASTGAVSDAHEILSFEVYDMKKMEEDGHDHQHVNPSNFAPLHDDSIISLIVSVVFWILVFSAFAVVIYLGSLYFRTKDKKRGHII